MSDCLTKENLELLNKRQLRGRGLVNALKHLEKCEKCRRKIKLPGREEVLRRIFDDEDEISAILSQVSSPGQKK